MHTPSCLDSAAALHSLLASAPPVGETGWVFLPMPQVCVQCVLVVHARARVCPSIACGGGIMRGNQTCHRVLRVIVFSIYLCAPQTVEFLKRAFPCILSRGTIGGPIKLITKAVPPGSGREKTTHTINQRTHKQKHADATPPSGGEDVTHPGIQLDPLLPSASEGVVLIEFTLTAELLWLLDCVHSPAFTQLMHDHQTAQVCGGAGGGQGGGRGQRVYAEVCVCVCVCVLKSFFIRFGYPRHLSCSKH